MGYCSECEGKGGLCKYHKLVGFLQHTDTDRYGKVETENTMMGWHDTLIYRDEEIGPDLEDEEKVDHIFNLIDRELSDRNSQDIIEKLEQLKYSEETLDNQESSEGILSGRGYNAGLEDAIDLLKG